MTDESPVRSPLFRKRCFLAALAIAIALLAIFHRPLLPLAMHWLDIGEPPVKSKAVFVLLGGEDTRPFAAAALVRAGFADEIVIAKSEIPSESKQAWPADKVCMHIFKTRGIAEDQVVRLGTGATNTMDEIVVLGEYLDANPDAIVTVLTTHFHTRRTRWSLRHRLGEKANRLRYVSAPHDDFNASNWWLYPYGFEYVSMEYIKLIAYWFLYGNALWYIAAGILMLLLWRTFRTKPPLATESTTSMPT